MNDIIIVDNVVQLKLVGGKLTVFNLSHLWDILDVSENWLLHTQGYAYCNNLKTIFLHSIISKGRKADHEDRNKLNNLDRNLRFCNSSQNAANKVKCIRNKSGYKGVSWCKLRNKWQVCLTYKYKRYYFGLFNDPIEAAKKYDIEAKRLWGKFAVLNFPEKSQIEGTNSDLI